MAKQGKLLDPTLRDLDEEADHLLAWVATLDPHWADLIEVIRYERHWNGRMILGAMVAHCLENGLQMAVPMHPYFEPGFVPTGSVAVCPKCGKEYKPAYQGQPLCSNACAVTDVKPEPAPPPVVDDLGPDAVQETY